MYLCIVHVCIKYVLQELHIHNEVRKNKFNNITNIANILTDLKNNFLYFVNNSKS